MLPPEVLARILKERDVLGLVMKKESEKRVYHFEIQTVEETINLRDFSLGDASHKDTAGTGWSSIQDSASRYLLMPEYEKIIYQIFFGVSPGQAWIYRQYPVGRDINSLRGVRTIGGASGYVSGEDSPYQSPSPLTETFTMQEIYPGYLGYHPFDEPTTIAVRLNFFIVRYEVKFMGVDPSGTDRDAKRLIAPESYRRVARVRTVGGRDPVDIPSWLEKAMGA